MIRTALLVLVLFSAGVWIATRSASLGGVTRVLRTAEQRAQTPAASGPAAKPAVPLLDEIVEVDESANVLPAPVLPPPKPPETKQSSQTQQQQLQQQLQNALAWKQRRLGAVSQNQQQQNSAAARRQRENGGATWNLREEPKAAHEATVVAAFKRDLQWVTSAKELVERTGIGKGIFAMKKHDWRCLNLMIVAHFDDESLWSARCFSPVVSLMNFLLCRGGEALLSGANSSDPQRCWRVIVLTAGNPPKHALRVGEFEAAHRLTGAEFEMWDLPDGPDQVRARFIFLLKLLLALLLVLFFSAFPALFACCCAGKLRRSPCFHCFST